MERLTERNPLEIDDEMWITACEPDDEEIEAVYHKLKEYEDLEEQGRLIKLPCKVGDTVYHIVQGRILEVDNVDLFFCCYQFQKTDLEKLCFLQRLKLNIG